LLAAERHDDHGSDVGMLAVRGERLVRHGEIRTELTAAREMGQRGADRRNRRGDAIGNDRRADDGRHDEHVIADADTAVRPYVAAKLGCQCHHSIGSAIRAADATPKSPRPRVLATLCVCTWSPGAMSRDAVPMGLPYLMTASWARIARSAILCPRGIASAATTVVSLTVIVRPASSGSSAVATLSRRLITSTAFIGSLRSPEIRRRRRAAGR